MSAVDGDRPGGAPPSPTNPSDGPPKLTYATAPADSRLRLREIWSGPFREALAERAAEIASESHVRAA